MNGKEKSPPPIQENKNAARCILLPFGLSNRRGMQAVIPSNSLASHFYFLYISNERIKIHKFENAILKIKNFKFLEKFIFVAGKMKFA